MNALRRRIVFAVQQPSRGALLSITDLLILLVLATLIYIGVRLAAASPQVLSGPDINLSPSALPYYALLSLGRMTAAYILSILFSLAYGYYAATKASAERVLLPILDVLQSVSRSDHELLILIVTLTYITQSLNRPCCALA